MVFSNRRTWKNVENYFPKYKKDKIVCAVEGSVGLMCFPALKDAEYFAGNIHCSTKRLKIIKVEGIGEKRVEPRISSFSFADLDSLDYIFQGKQYSYCPDKTVIFPKLKVLE